MEAKVIVLANHKGGCTKTTTTANLGASLAERGNRVLLVDCDPQANLSELFGVDELQVGERLEDLLANPAAVAGFAPRLALADDVGGELAWREQLALLPCTEQLAEVAAGLPTAGEGYELRLKTIVDEFRPHFDFILLDTPPGLGNLSGMALIAADQVLIPARPADLDVRGAGKVYDLVERERPDAEILGVLIAPTDHRWRVRGESHRSLEQGQMTVLPMDIPQAIRVAEAPRHRAPTFVLEPRSRVSEAYRQVAEHITGTVAA